MQPLVSIIIPAYNAGKYLAETIASAQAQTWPNIEVIVVNNASTDDTLKVIESFGDAIISINLPQNKGAAGARNAGLAVAKGSYIQFLDADDLLNPNKIEDQSKVLTDQPNCLAICRTVHFDDGKNHLDNEPVNSWFDADFSNPVEFLIKLYAGNEVMPGYGGMVPLHSWLTPAAVITKAGLWNEELSVDDDGEFFCRVILASDGIRYSDKALCYYRKFYNGYSLSGQRGRNAVQSAVKAIDLKYKELKAHNSTPVIDLIFARHYWWTGVLAFPRFKDLSSRCIKIANNLGYKGEKYVGGPAGHTIANIFGWRVARYIAYYLKIVKGAIS